MPSADPDLSQLIHRWFGPEDELHTLEERAHDFLLSHGFVDDRGKFLLPTPSHTVSEIEYLVISWFITEWDYDVATPPSYLPETIP